MLRKDLEVMAQEGLTEDMAEEGIGVVMAAERLEVTDVETWGDQWYFCYGCYNWQSIFNN